MRLSRLWLTLAAVAASAPPLLADVKPHALFGDAMVLQRGGPVPVWGTADPGEAVTVTLKLDADGRAATAQTTADDQGRWSVKLEPAASPGPFTLSFQGKNAVTFKDVLLGEVWICSGQSNMEWPLKASFQADEAIAKAKHPNIRLFTVPRKTASVPQTNVDGKWKVCTPESAADFSAVGYYFGRDLHKNLNVPVGLIKSAWGGTPAQAWTSTEALAAVPELKYYPEQLARQIENYNGDDAKTKHQEALAKHKEAAAKAKAEGKQAPRAPQLFDPDKSQNSPARLYNGMIAPLVPFAFKGVIWYQGESNANKAYEYRKLMPTLIADWRNQWKRGDFPFLIVSLAPFQKIRNEPGESNWAELREAQWLTTKALPNVGLAVITDVGEENDIHPRKKEPVGARLALAARKIAYRQPIVASGPEYASLKVEGNKAVVSFTNVGAGLECRGDALTGFTVRGEDRQWHNAKAEIRGDTVAVWSDAVEKPVAVRFGWAQFPVVNLWNKDGLPAVPFRTDDDPVSTQPKAKE